jgi:hypothetical protein
MLFVTDDASGQEKDDVVNSVVIPNAASVNASHPDGSAAVYHTAGLLLMQKGRPPVHYPLAGRKVEIVAEGEGNLPGVDEAFLGVPPVHEMINPKGKRAEPIRREKAPPVEPTVITFKGGRMSGEMVFDEKIQLTRHGDDPIDWTLTSMPVWQSAAARGKIKLSGGGDPDLDIDLGPDVSVYIYNWDLALPTAESLRKAMDPTNGAVDEDFKWVYSLLKPASKTWKQLMGSDPLPTPRVKPGGSISLTPATCNSARVRGVSLA